MKNRGHLICFGRLSLRLIETPVGLKHPTTPLPQTPTMNVPPDPPKSTGSNNNLDELVYMDRGSLLNNNRQAAEANLAAVLQSIPKKKTQEVPKRKPWKKPMVRPSCAHHACCCCCCCCCACVCFSCVYAPIPHLFRSGTISLYRTCPRGR